VPTSTLRGILLAVAVVVGALLIGKGFQTSTSQALTPPSPSPSVSPSPSASVSPSPSESPGLTHKEAVKGVKIQVLNGTGTSGLAATVADTLRGKGYTIYGVSNAGKSTYQTTIIYYEQGQKSRAEYMEQHYLSGAQVKPAGSLFSAPVQLSVIVGADMATSSST